MSYNPFSLAGKTILITGASSGIGKAIAIECSKMGATVVITGRNAERLTETFNQLEKGNHIQLIADLSNENEVNNFIDLLPSLNGIVHSAGIVATLPFRFISEEKLQETLSVNFISPTIISQKLIKQKKIEKGASIVWISSIAGNNISSVGKSMYGASKGAVNSIVKGMALELAPQLIRVNSVNPGMINTPILNEGTISKEQLEEDAKKYPLKRYGNPEEVAYAVIYLLSDASAWVTGSHLLIDGGFTLN